MTDRVDHLRAMRPAHYINNREFYEEMKVFIEENKHLEPKARPKIPDAIAKKIMAICENLSRSRNFASSPHREDLVGNAIENCILRIRNFDPDRFSNPFSYFTQIAWFSFIRTIAEEKKEYVGKNMWAKEVVVWEILSHAAENGSDPENFEFMNHIKQILNFEEPKPDPTAPKRTTLAHQKRLKEKAAQEAQETEVSQDQDEAIISPDEFMIPADE